MNPGEAKVVRQVYVYGSGFPSSVPSLKKEDCSFNSPQAQSTSFKNHAVRKVSKGLMNMEFLLSGAPRKPGRASVMLPSLPVNHQTSHRDRTQHLQVTTIPILNDGLATTRNLDLGYAYKSPTTPNENFECQADLHQTSQDTSLLNQPSNKNYLANLFDNGSCKSDNLFSTSGYAKQHGLPPENSSMSLLANTAAVAAAHSAATLESVVVSCAGTQTLGSDKASESFSKATKTDVSKQGKTCCSQKLSTGEVARTAAAADIAERLRVAYLARTNHISEEEFARFGPEHERNADIYKRAAPSRFCHICNRSGKHTRLAACSKFNVGTCRKVICEKCFPIHSYGDFESALRTSKSHWLCPHCIGACPSRAQCWKYRCVNDRLRIARLRRGYPFPRLSRPSLRSRGCKKSNAGAFKVNVVRKCSRKDVDLDIRTEPRSTAMTSNDNGYGDYEKNVPSASCLHSRCLSTDPEQQSGLTDNSLHMVVQMSNLEKRTISHDVSTKLVSCRPAASEMAGQDLQQARTESQYANKLAQSEFQDSSICNILDASLLMDFSANIGQSPDMVQEKYASDCHCDQLVQDLTAGANDLRVNSDDAGHSIEQNSLNGNSRIYEAICGSFLKTTNSIIDGVRDPHDSRHPDRADGIEVKDESVLSDVEVFPETLNASNGRQFVTVEMGINKNAHVDDNKKGFPDGEDWMENSAENDERGQ